MKGTYVPLDDSSGIHLDEPELAEGVSLGGLLIKWLCGAFS